MYWRKEERETVAVLYGFTKMDINARLIMEFSDHESYLVTYDTSYDSDNSYEIDAGVDSCEDDFYELSYFIEKIIKQGSHKNSDSDYLQINYRDFPICVTTEEGLPVYPKKLTQKL
ncbi:MAG: hypothetical protein LBK67_04560 [Coriobacteriales bacterium]|jgi:hypothetical protein|nr:hypothetical protein [Coriobacteriales bacterium]